MNPNAGESGAASGAKGADASEGQEGLPAGVTVEALADRVYRLMLREVRLERARGASGWERAGE